MIRDILGLIGLDIHLQRHLVDAAVRLSSAIDAQVVRNSEEPSAHGSPAVEPVNVLKRLDEHFLGDIGCFFGGLYHSLHEAEYSSFIGIHDFSESFVIVPTTTV